MASSTKNTKNNEKDANVDIKGDLAQDGSKPVPESFEDITPEWCQWALRKGGIIGENTNIIDAEVDRFKNKETGEVDDGGGMTEAKMLRIKLKYGGEVNGSEPESTVAKIMFGFVNKTPIQWRIIMSLMGGELDVTNENFWRNDIRFCRKILPIIDEKFSHPKVYYTGITDKGDRNFLTGAILNKPCKVKTVTLMADMKEWDSYNWFDVNSIMVGGVELPNSAECLKNIAFLHAQFWGENNSQVKQLFKPSLKEHWNRPAAHNKVAAWKRKKVVSNKSSMQKGIKKLMETWQEHAYFAFKPAKVKSFPEWFSPEPLEDGSLPLFKDNSVLEMIDVFASRYPDFAKSVADASLKQPLQTICHGDFHAGNHMYGRGANKGKVVVFDYQGVGMGLVAQDVVEFLLYAAPYSHFGELSKVYHTALVENGVTDYPWDTFKKDLQIILMEAVLKNLMDFSELTIKQLDQWVKIFGDKAQGFQKLFESGICGYPILAATDIYLKDKENFLIPESFDKNIWTHLN